MPRTGQVSDRIGAIAGVAFAMLFFLSVFVANPVHGETDQLLLEQWTDGGVRRDLIVSMFLMLLAGPCFLVFVSQLRARLRAAEPESAWGDLVHGTGVVFVATLSITAFSRGLIAQAVRFGGEPLPSPDTLRYATAFSDAAFGLASIPFATLAVATASTLILQTGAMSRWVGWLGLGVTALSLGTIVLLIGPFATPLIAIWVLVASVQLFRARRTRVVPADASQGIALSQPPSLVS